MMNSSAASSAPKAKRVAKKTDEVAAAPAPAPVTSPAAPAPAPAAPAAKAKKAAAPAPAAPVAAPVAAPAVPVAAPAADATPAAPQTSLDDDLKSVLTTLTGLRETISTMITEVKRLDKRVHREIKDARKRKRRVRSETEGAEGAPRRLTIFEIPLKVSDELCRFLGHPTGTLISRSNVTKQVNNYVKEKGLKNKHNITPDAALKKILQVPEGEQLTYFNLQKYLNKHYIKDVKA